MQDNYVKLLRPQVRDLGERGGRGSILSSSSSQPHTNFHSMSGVLKPNVGTERPTETLYAGGGVIFNVEIFMLCIVKRLIISAVIPELPGAIAQHGKGSP